MSTPKVTLPGPDDWSTAVKALDKGKGDPMAELLRQLQYPQEWVNVFAVALATERDLQKALADGEAAGDLDLLSRERWLLGYSRPTTAEEGKQIALRMVALEKQIAAAHRAATAKPSIELNLQWLHSYFPELFGQPTPNSVYGSIPAAVREVLLETFKQREDAIPRNNWRDMPLHHLPPTPRRRVRAAGF